MEAFLINYGWYNSTSLIEFGRKFLVSDVERVKILSELVLFLGHKKVGATHLYLFMQNVKLAGGAPGKCYRFDSVVIKQEINFLLNIKGSTTCHIFIIIRVSTVGISNENLKEQLLSTASSWRSFWQIDHLFKNYYNRGRAWRRTRVVILPMKFVSE